MKASNDYYSNTIPSLDGMRAVSVLLVVIGHSGFANFVPGGFGVTIFFFLSGYLITKLLLDEFIQTGTISIRDFYIRRFFRLAPSLFITLGLAYGLVYAGLLSGGISFAGFLSQVFYLANYNSIFFHAIIPDGTGILWSLAVEEHFYLFYPLILLGLVKIITSKFRIAFVLTIVCALCLAWRCYLASRPGFQEWRTYYASDTRIDSIAYGCLLALLFGPVPAPRDHKPTAAQLTIVCAALVAIAGTFFYKNDFLRETFRYSVQGMALIPIFYLAIRFHSNRSFAWLNTWPAIRVGRYSYEIYLAHFIVIFVLKPHLSWSATILIAAFSSSLMYAALLNRFVSPYFVRLRRRFHHQSPRISLDSIGEIPARSSLR